MMRISQAVATAVIAMCAHDAIAQNGVDKPTWSNYQGDAAHTGYVPVTLNPATFGKLWSTSLEIGGVIPVPLSAVTEAAGIAYVSTSSPNGRSTHALNAHNGAILWAAPFEGSTGRVNSSADSGYAFVQVTDAFSHNALYRIEGSTGIGAAPMDVGSSSPYDGYLAPTTSAGRVYLGGGSPYTWAATVAAVLEDMTSPGPIWTNTLVHAKGAGWTPAVDGTRVYSYAGDGNLYVADKWSGAAVGQGFNPNCCTSSTDVGTAVTLGAANDAIVVDGGNVTSFDLATRMPKWSYPMTANGGFSSQASIASGVIYAIQNGALVALDEVTGAKLWSWAAANTVLAGPVVVTDSHVFVAGPARTWSVKIATHASDWSYPASGQLSLSEGVLYIAGPTGTVTAISVGSGSSAPQALTVALANSFVATGVGEVVTHATVTNSGASAAYAVVLTINVPKAFLQGTMPAGCGFVGEGLINCNISSIPAGGHVTEGMTFNSRGPSWTPGSFTMTAHASGANVDTFNRLTWAFSTLAVPQ